VSGKLHAPAALTPGEEPVVPIGLEAEPVLMHFIPAGLRYCGFGTKLYFS